MPSAKPKKDFAIDTPNRHREGGGVVLVFPDPRAKSDSGSPHPDSEPADGNGFGPETIPASNGLAADYPEDGSKSNNGVLE